MGEVMGTRIAAFVKTPGLSELKTRLARSSSRQLADQFYEKSLAAIDEWMSIQSKKRDSEVFWAVAEDPCLVSSIWKHHPIVPQGGGELGERLARVYSHLNQNGEYLVVLIGADSPQLSMTLVEQTLEAIAKGFDLVIGPSRDGGFYWFASRVAIPNTTWTSVTYSVRSTLRDLLATSYLRKLSVHFLAELTDVDEFDDLKYVADDLRKLGSELSASQIKLLDWIESLDPK
jgi:glycosyltransferase A (GT-A) superfamily protein (DUF2064 family)